MENLSLSVPDLLQTVKNYVGPEKHEQLDEMLQRYTSKQLGKQQVGPPCHLRERPLGHCLRLWCRLTEGSGCGRARLVRDLCEREWRRPPVEQLPHQSLYVGGMRSCRRVGRPFLLASTIFHTSCAPTPELAAAIRASGGGRARCPSPGIASDGAAD